MHEWIERLIPLIADGNLPPGTTKLIGEILEAATEMVLTDSVTERNRWETMLRHKLAVLKSRAAYDYQVV